MSEITFGIFDKDNNKYIKITDNMNITPYKYTDYSLDLTNNIKEMSIFVYDTVNQTLAFEKTLTEKLFLNKKLNIQVNTNPDIFLFDFQTTHDGKTKFVYETIGLNMTLKYVDSLRSIKSYFGISSPVGMIQTKITNPPNYSIVKSFQVPGPSYWPHLNID
jgi:hypothetical protein